MLSKIWRPGARNTEPPKDSPEACRSTKNLESKQLKHFPGRSGRWGERV
jgi:hypothetical protein